jgi:hypothetical protein
VLGLLTFVAGDVGFCGSTFAAGDGVGLTGSVEGLAKGSLIPIIGKVGK